MGSCVACMVPRLRDMAKTVELGIKDCMGSLSETSSNTPLCRNN